MLDIQYPAFIRRSFYFLETGEGCKKASKLVNAPLHEARVFMSTRLLKKVTLPCKRELSGSKYKLIYYSFEVHHRLNVQCALDLFKTLLL